MKRLDLDDLPPKLAALLTGLGEGEELLLVQNGGVAGRLTALAPPPSVEDPAEQTPEQAAEVFELFRSAMEDEF
ncbi:hypothetical protein [Phenylobacterium aquaticum]|uniref:hypothetical protein n=1 Tax=Phenylobacterium aquaticum TaxID=1763816 RepID=UPI0026F2876F|nr:hypothetical protein [Phenylobacterium aquaticum]